MNLKKLHIYLHDFLLFLKSPAQEPGEMGSLLSTGARFWMAYVTEVIIALIISLPLIYLIDHFLLRLQLVAEFADMDNLFVAIVLIVILAPVLEELLFRYPLKFIKPRFLKLAVYSSSLLFGLIHISNYENNQWLFYVLIPVIVSSQSLGGFVLAYLRLREGFLWSMMAHALFNATFILFSLLFNQNRLVVEETNERYDLTIREYSFREGKQVTEFYRSGERIDSIVWKQASLQSLVDSLSSTPLTADQALINMTLKTGRSMPADSVLWVLKKEYRIE